MPPMTRKSVGQLLPATGTVGVVGGETDGDGTTWAVPQVQSDSVWQEGLRQKPLVEPAVI